MQILPIDSDSLTLIHAINAQAAGFSPSELTPQKRRDLYVQSNTILSPHIALGVNRENLSIPLDGRSLPARSYRPVTAAQHGAKDLLLVFFHGGGWVLGDLDTHDNACAFLAENLGCTVLSVEYRKSPEYPYPVPCDDAAQAYAWAWANIATFACKRIAVAGDSAGGYLAAHAVNVNSLVSDLAVPTVASLLFYPATGLCGFDTPSYAERGAGPGLTAAGMQWYLQQFLGDARLVRKTQLTCPKTPPPTVLSLAWHDPLHDDGIAYAKILQDAGGAGDTGGKAEVLVAADMAHGFLRQCTANEAAKAHVQAACKAFLRFI